MHFFYSLKLSKIHKTWENFGCDSPTHLIPMFPSSCGRGCGGPPPRRKNSIISYIGWFWWLAFIQLFTKKEIHFWLRTPHKFNSNVSQLLWEGGVGVFPHEENFQLFHTMVDSGDLLLYNYSQKMTPPIRHHLIAVGGFALPGWT